MTREEAIKVAERAVADSTVGAYGSFPEALITTLEQLKLIRLDRPPPPKDSAFHFVAAWNSYSANKGGPMIGTPEVKRALEAAGLELVEKKP